MKNAAQHAPASSKGGVLVAVTGLSPAILTETVWALAQESPPTIPDRVIALTTATGKIAIQTQLFGPDGVWDQLRAAILGKEHAADSRLDFDVSPDRVKVAHRRAGTRRVPLDGLATREDHAAFADALTDELWTHTSKEDSPVIGSLAGGFKTMSALMHASMQLLANREDRLTHVLVSGGYESCSPAFYFPTQRNQRLQARDGSLLRARDAAKRIQLIDVPIVPLRRWFAEVLDRKPPSFDVLISSTAEALKARAEDAHLEVGPLAPANKMKHWVRVNGQHIDLSIARYAYLRFFAKRALEGTAGDGKVSEAAEAFVAWLARAKETEPRLSQLAESLSQSSPQDRAEALPKRISDLRKFLKSRPGGAALADALPGKGAWKLSLPPARIKLSD